MIPGLFAVPAHVASRSAAVTAPTPPPIVAGKPRTTFEFSVTTVDGSEIDCSHLQAFVGGKEIFIQVDPESPDGQCSIRAIVAGPLPKKVYVHAGASKVAVSPLLRLRAPSQGTITLPRQATTPNQGTVTLPR